jgi:polynucleotide 5'-hydroxyl-kinase GRC3/NOL9
VPEEWWRLSSAFLSKTDGDLPPIILICGPRKVGKSTFGRFFVNQLLNRYPKVAHVDLDLGQTEFNPPGFISLKIIEEALLGTMFCS